MRNLITMLILAGFSSFAFGQLSLERQVVSTTGGMLENGQTSLSTTVGETVVETISQGTLVFTQGFQQEVLTGAVSIDNAVDVNLEYQIYPNPTTSTVTLSLEYPTSANMTISVIDNAGKKVLSDKQVKLVAGMNNTELDVSALATGVYRIVLFSDKHKTGAVFNLEKL
ncbi:MAG: T9SS type A sorting domain-containing protein [Bacteroidia bacterium]